MGLNVMLFLVCICVVVCMGRERDEGSLSGLLVCESIEAVVRGRCGGHKGEGAEVKDLGNDVVTVVVVTGANRLQLVLWRC